MRQVALPDNPIYVFGEEAYQAYVEKMKERGAYCAHKGLPKELVRLAYTPRRKWNMGHWNALRDYENATGVKILPGKEPTLEPFCAFDIRKLEQLYECVPENGLRSEIYVEPEGEVAESIDQSRDSQNLQRQIEELRQERLKLEAAMAESKRQEEKMKQTMRDLDAKKARSNNGGMSEDDIDKISDMVAKKVSSQLPKIKKPTQAQLKQDRYEIRYHNLEAAKKCIRDCRDEMFRDDPRLPFDFEVIEHADPHDDELPVRFDIGSMEYDRWVASGGKAAWMKKHKLGSYKYERVKYVEEKPKKSFLDFFI